VIRVVAIDCRLANLAWPAGLIFHNARAVWLSHGHSEWRLLRSAAPLPFILECSNRLLRLVLQRLLGVLRCHISCCLCSFWLEEGDPLRSSIFGRDASISDLTRAIFVTVSW